MANTTERALYGRKQIFTSATAITAENVVNEVVVKALVKHLNNRSDIDYLFKYYKGDCPIRYRTKEVRPEINSRIVENRAQEIVSFKVGYLCGNEIQYVSRNADDNVSADVATLNDLMAIDCKATKDKSLIEWNMICGTGYRLVLPNVDEDGAPFTSVVLDPRNCFVIYSNDVMHRVLAGVYYVTDEETSINTYSVYTPKEYFELKDSKIVRHEFHALDRVPIIEYPANNARMGAFEPVLPLLDAINEVDSNRLDGIKQFIESLVILYNCELPEGETANTIRENGLISLKSIGENKADIKILSEQLNQTETQTLKEDLYQTVLTIVGMPSQGNGSTGDSSNNGAVILKNGWQGAEARAKDSELMFKASEREFLQQVLRICRDIGGLKLYAYDVDVHFTRRNYEDILSKSQVLVTMLQNEKIAPKLAFTACGLFVDSEEAYRESMEWYEASQAKATELAKLQAEAQPKEEEETEEPESTEPTEVAEDEEK